MAQKSLKTLATRNTATLNRMHLISLSFHLLYHILRFFFRRQTSLLLYVVLSAPSLAIQATLEYTCRPRHSQNGELRTAGSDANQGGVTEWMWDVMYWTWGCIGFAAVFGDRAWWGWTIVPLYSGWVAWGAVKGVKQGMGMGAGAAGGEGQTQQGQSKRQEKMEKRGGQKVKYR